MQYFSILKGKQTIIYNTHTGNVTWEYKCKALDSYNKNYTAYIMILNGMKLWERERDHYISIKFKKG